MRVTCGKCVRRYVYDVRLGDTRAVGLYRGDKKLWPTLSDTVYSCVLDVGAMAGTEDWLYWLHVLDVLERLEVGEECFVRLVAGGREYMLGKGFGGWRVAAFDGRATVVFGDDGPLCERLRVGDDVEVEVCVPQRESSGVDVNPKLTRYVEEEYWLPWLRGSKLSFVCDKRKDKQIAHCRFTVWGQDSGTVHIDGRYKREGHSHGKKVVSRAAEAAKRMDAWNDGCVLGDVGCKVGWRLYNGGTSIYNGRLIWPAFRRVFRFKVSVVVRHD